mmetsp:Transcript_14855/g.27585  ORF Transcript_14855/g.27585 Transcript_14855/m.27585 type:complete len:218 (-) Transcript_14855:3083-3736(-)
MRTASLAINAETALFPPLAARSAPHVRPARSQLKTMLLVGIVRAERNPALLQQNVWRAMLGRMRPLLQTPAPGVNLESIREQARAAVRAALRERSPRACEMSALTLRRGNTVAIRRQPASNARRAHGALGGPQNQRIANQVPSLAPALIVALSVNPPQSSPMKVRCPAICVPLVKRPTRIGPSASAKAFSFLFTTVATLETTFLETTFGANVALGTP